MYLQFPYVFLNTEMAQVGEILPHSPDALLTFTL